MCQPRPKDEEGIEELSPPLPGTVRGAGLKGLTVFRGELVQGAFISKALRRLRKKFSWGLRGSKEFTH